MKLSYLGTPPYLPTHRLRHSEYNCMLNRLLKTRLLEHHLIRYHGPSGYPSSMLTSLVAYQAAYQVESGIVGLQGPAPPTAHLPVGACRQLRACEEVALFRQHPAGSAKNEKHHRVPGFQCRGTQNQEQSTTRYQVFYLYHDLPTVAQDPLVWQCLPLTGFPTAPLSQCLEDHPSLGKALI